MSAHDLPVIDLGLLRSDRERGRLAIAAALREVCEATGFFYVKNHGIDPVLQDAVFAASRRFFALPLEVKREVEMRGADMERGYEGIGAQTLDVATGPDRKESIFVGVDLPLDHPLVLAGTPHHGPNRWPRLPGWREPVEAWFGAMERLARLLMNGLALSLEMPWGYFDFCLENHMSSLRLLHYPPHPDANAAHEVGCGAHTDWGAITMLAQDADGLEIRHADGHWLAAPTLPGTFIVNLGDMMARWTNDRYASTPHRVLNRSARDRYSAAFFFDPAFHTRVECLPTCRSAARPARYPPITSGKHLAAMYRKTYAQPEATEALT
jgi:isopenicillin N synthase-like dioxygenase